MNTQPTARRPGHLGVSLLALALAMTAAPGARTEAWPERCTLDNMPTPSADFAGIAPPPAELVEAAVAEGALVLYSAVSEPVTIDNVVDRFQKAYPGITVTWTTAGGGSQRRARFLAEAEAGQTTADVITDFSTGFFRTGFADGHIVPMTEVIEGFADQWPEDLHWSSEGGLTGVHTFSPFGFAYNTARVPAELAPETWEDLTDPAFKGHIQVKDINASSNTANHFHFLRDTLGDEGFAAFAANLSLTPLHADAQIMSQELAAGGTWVMPQAQPNVIDAIAATGAPVKSIVPDTVGGSQYAIGVSASAKNPNAARLFAHWNYTAQGQWINACEMRSGSPVFPGYGPGNFNAYTRTSDDQMVELNQMMGLKP